MASPIFFKQTFRCIIRDRDTVLFQGDALAVTTKNEVGLMDVLPEHTNFISIVQESIEVVKNDGKSLKLPIEKGVLKVLANEVRIYLGIFSSISKIKAQSTEQRA